MEMKRS